MSKSLQVLRAAAAAELPLMRRCRTKSCVLRSCTSPSSSSSAAAAVVTARTTRRRISGFNNSCCTSFPSLLSPPPPQSRHRWISSSSWGSDDEPDKEKGGRTVLATVHRTTSSHDRNKQQQAAELEREEQERLENRLHEALGRYDAYLKEEKETKGKEDIKDDRLLTLLTDVRECYEALQYWEQALTVEEAIWDALQKGGDDDDDNAGVDKSDWERAEALYRQGKLHMRMNKFGQAQRLYHRALEGYRRWCCAQAATNKDAPGDDDDDESYLCPEIGNVLISMAGIHYHRGHLQESLDLLLESESNFVVVNSDADEGTTTTPHTDLIKCLQHQGLLYRSMEDFDSALKAYQRALDVMEQIHRGDDGDDEKEEYHNKRQGIQLDIADMYGALDERQKALDLYLQVLEEEKGYRAATAEGRDGSSTTTALEGIVLHNCGKIYASMGNYEKAIEDLELALKIKLEILSEEHVEVGKTLQSLGAVYAMTGDNNNKSRALECFQRALLIARIHAHRDDDDHGASVDEDPQVLLALRNIAILKGEKVDKWEDEEDGGDGEKGKD